MYTSNGSRSRSSSSGSREACSINVDDDRAALLEGSSCRSGSGKMIKAIVPKIILDDPVLAKGLSLQIFVSLTVFVTFCLLKEGFRD